MIGTLARVVLDTRDPRGLAEFYARLLGARIVTDKPDWVTIADDAGHELLSFQTAPGHEPPRFPDPAGSQQFHVDVQVSDVDEAERKVLELGATRVTDAYEDHWGGSDDQSAGRGGRAHAAGGARRGAGAGGRHPGGGGGGHG